MNSIEIQNLKRVFTLERRARKHSGKELVALQDINLEIKPGELFGLLGPNGAGKTTLIRILCTLLLPTSGQAFVDGIDISDDVNAVRRIINMVSGGETCGYGILTARENLRLFTELYGIPWKIARPRVEKMLKVVGLDDKRGVRTNRMSTGMRQRLNFARGFTTDPKVLFLDEPTVGMDVHAAIEIRGFIQEWLANHPEKTIMLTTHYMAEADQLCDRIAIIDKGKIQACDTPEALKRMVSREASMDITLAGAEAPPEEWKTYPGVTELSFKSDHEAQTNVIHALLESPEAGGEFIRAVAQNGRRILDLKTTQASLEDVFLKITGRSLTEAEKEEDTLTADKS